MAFRINRLRVASSEDAGFSELVSALPDSVDKCHCCDQPIERRSRDSIAMVLIADESDDNPLAVYSAVCLTCDLPPEKWTPGYADFRSACSGVM